MSFCVFPQPYKIHYEQNSQRLVEKLGKEVGTCFSWRFHVSQHLCLHHFLATQNAPVCSRSTSYRSGAALMNKAERWMLKK